MITHSRIACGIDVPDSDNIVITGGWNGISRTPGFGGISRVVKYNTQGDATLLPSLQQPRRFHGCGYYYNNEQVVSCKLYIVLRLSDCIKILGFPEVSQLCTPFVIILELGTEIIPKN